MKRQAFDELLLLPGRFAATVKCCAKEQEKLLCKGVYLYLVSTQQPEFLGRKKDTIFVRDEAMQANRKCSGCVRYDVSTATGHSKQLCNVSERLYE